MLGSQSKDGALAVIAEPPAVGNRLARVLRTASGFRHTTYAPSLAELPAEVGRQTRLIACSVRHLRDVIDSCESRFPHAWVVVWLTEPSPEVFRFAGENQRIISVVGWTPDQPSPRIWELTLPVQRLFSENGNPLKLRDLFQWDGIQTEWFPRSTADLHATLDGVGAALERLGITRRTGRRIVGVAHEMLMNAMYDAPVDERGQPRFAYNRDKHIALDPRDAPHFTLGTDGLTLALQVSDPFGGLRRKHVFGSLRRGHRSTEADARPDEIMDTSHGGAGLGLHRIVSEATTTVIDVVPNSSTIVTTTFELDHSNRELRKIPRSLHYYQRASTRMRT